MDRKSEGIVGVSIIGEGTNPGEIVQLPDRLSQAGIAFFIGMTYTGSIRRKANKELADVMTESFKNNSIHRNSKLKTQAVRLSGRPGMSLTGAFNRYAIMHLYRGGRMLFCPYS